MRRVVRSLAVAALFGVLWGQAGPTVRQEVNPAAAARGRAVYTQFCVNCHGVLAKGTEEAPDLIRSPLVLRDRVGSELGPALKRLAGHKSDLTNAQVVDITHFLKEQIENTAKNRNPERPPNVLTGNLAAGRAYFNAKCNSCHSVTGDLAGVGRRFQDPVDLQQRFLFPRRTKPVQVSVEGVTGDLVRIDDFTVSLKTSAGEQRTWTRTDALRVEVSDPLKVHVELLDVYTDKDMHDVVRYLESLK